MVEEIQYIVRKKMEEAKLCIESGDEEGFWQEVREAQSVERKMRRLRRQRRIQELLEDHSWT